MAGYMLYLRFMAFLQIFRPNPGGRINPLRAAVVGALVGLAWTALNPGHGPGGHNDIERMAGVLGGATGGMLAGALMFAVVARAINWARGK
jgi:hypothetical protein